MVPDFKLSRIKLIFGDQFLKQSLLVKLNIEETCVLRCDYYHCMNEVWPSRNNFGVVVMAKIRQYLEGMLTCHTKAQWEILSKKALKEIENDPRKTGKLLNIVNSVTYYAGFYLRSLEGNLDLLGSTPAEINHLMLHILGKVQVGQFQNIVPIYLKGNSIFQQKKINKRMSTMSQCINISLFSLVN